MKYLCKNFKTLENGITGALNFDVLKWSQTKISICIECKIKFHEKIAMKYSCKNFRTLENGITGALNFYLLKRKKMVPNQNFDMHRI